jgi:two-component system, OmpR family, sensor histidine kinase SenX3
MPRRLGPLMLVIRPFRPPMLVIAAALLGLIAILATLQYRWLGQISSAERETMTATLNARASVFAEDVDRELTLAYRLFQVEAVADADATAAAKLAARHERWSAMSRHPRLIKDYFVTSHRDGAGIVLHRFDPAAGTLTAVAWPAALETIRSRIQPPSESVTKNGTLVIRTFAAPLWEDVPAIVVPAPTPLVMLDRGALPQIPETFGSYLVLVLDRDYLAKEMLPALASQHFRGLGDGIDFQMAVVKTTDGAAIYQSTPAFQPSADTKADASADLFQIRPQDFSQLVSDVRRFTAIAPPPGTIAGQARGSQALATFTVPLTDNMTYTRRVLGVERPTDPKAAATSATRGAKVDAAKGDKPTMMVLEHATALRDRTIVASIGDAAARQTAATWRLLVKHPSGSLEAAVNNARRRNLLISSSILGVLAASLVLIVASSRRSQELARQQMEFVAGVSHELRTPLAVIRSAADNLADGVVDDSAQIKRYGALVRSEGRRLTEMVEQILEFSGIHSGQRTLTMAPVRVAGTIASVMSASDALIDAAGLRVEIDIPDDLPPVLGDEAALRRVFQNLIGNAIKYGVDGGWIGISARRSGTEVHISIRDRGIGIAPADHGRIFEPFYRAADVVAAQIQGAGLGLSLVQRIVQAHAGRITVKSAKGTGSEFIVHLHAASEQAHEHTALLPRHSAGAPDAT